MKKLLKRVLLCILTLSLITSINFKHNTVQAFKNDDIKPMAWPGRPGGDPTGDESTGYTCKGSWVYRGSRSGRAEDIRRADEDTVKGMWNGLNLMTFFGPTVAGALGLLPDYKSNIKGDLYTARFYTSDNCTRVEYEFRMYYSSNIVDRRTKYSRFR